MAKLIAALAVVGALGTPAVAQTARDEPEPGQYRSIYDCLAAVALEQEQLATCQGLEARRYLNEIAEARGNLGLRAVSSAYAIELGAWLSAWASVLEDRLWHPQDSPESAISRFTALQKRATDVCIRPGNEPELPMERIAPCIAEIYGPALVEELRW